jgi:hypothetical protein
MAIIQIIAFIVLQVLSVFSNWLGSAPGWHL